MQHCGQVGGDVAVDVGRAGFANGIVAKANYHIALAKFRGAGDVNRLGNGVRGRYVAGDAVAEGRVQETGDVGGVFPGAYKFAHQNVGAHLDLSGGYVVELVVLLLLGAATGRFADGFIHGAGDGIGIHYHQAVDVAGGTAGGLGEGTAGAEEAFLIGIQNGHQGYCGDVQAFAEEVYADEDVEEAVFEILDYFHALCGVYVRVYVSASDAHLGEVAVQFLCHALGEGGD